MPTFIDPSSQNAEGQTYQTITMKRDGSATAIKGPPAILRKIVFWIGDVVWPDWSGNAKGREIYLKYADGCEDGELNVFNKGFFDKAWPRVQLHLTIDGVLVEDLNDKD
jgi:hypothetical protein